MPDPAIGPTGPVVGGADPLAAAQVVGGSDPSAIVPPSSPRRSFKPFLIALAAVLVVGIGSAVAYIGIILPNKPINVLKQSLANSLQEPQSSFKGTVASDPSAAGGTAYKADFSGAADTATKKAEFKLDFTVTGITFPIEARLVNKNVYVKAGDLSTVAGLVSAYSPQFGGLAQTLSSQLSNKWIVIDSTLLNQSGVGCFLDTSWSVTNADIQLLNNAYNKHAFVTIKSTGTDSVNGQNAEKLVLSIDNDKLAALGNDKTLDNLSLVKSSQKCDKTISKNVSNAKGNHGQTPLTIWVDKGKKRIVKIAYQDPAKKNGSAEVTVSYNKVAITAPSNAVPAVQILTQIEQSAASNPAMLNLLGGSTPATQ